MKLHLNMGLYCTFLNDDGLILRSAMKYFWPLCWAVYIWQFLRRFAVMRSVVWDSWLRVCAKLYAIICCTVLCTCAVHLADVDAAWCLQEDVQVRIAKCILLNVFCVVSVIIFCTEIICVGTDIREESYRCCPLIQESVGKVWNQLLIFLGWSLWFEFFATRSLTPLVQVTRCVSCEELSLWVLF